MNWCPNRENLAFIADRIDLGKVIPLIDKRVSLNEVADAIRYLEDRQVRGKVVITMNDADIFCRLLILLSTCLIAVSFELNLCW